MLHQRSIPAVLLFFLLALGPGPAALALDETADALARAILSSDPDLRKEALATIERDRRTDLVAPLIQALRFLRTRGDEVASTLADLTGEAYGNDWHAWMLWQERHPEIQPFDGFDAYKADVMAQIDPAFRLFLRPGIEHTIRLEEIAWGGVRKDGIPALVDPDHLPAAEATYLDDDELVFGVEIGGDARAYPLRILDWHEMANDVVGGVPVALAYCTLCGSGILFETARENGERLVFGSSGFLYRSNKLMYDQATHSLWNQFTGRPVVGPLTTSGIDLEVLPLVITSWARWVESHPQTRVLSLETGHTRTYEPGAAYGTYFSSPDLMFPSVVDDLRLPPKTHVFALRTADAEKAWPLDRFTSEPVINDRVGATDVVLVGEAATRTVRAYARGGRIFRLSDEELEADGVDFEITEAALVGADGTRLERLPGHIAYWFAWQSFKPDAEADG